MSSSIAIVGMACRYPDARSPVDLWENVLAERQAFRRMPPERLRLEDYLSADRNAPDSIYPIEATLIEGYEFDRVRFRVAGSTFRSADLTHWLALDVASQALADAGMEEGEGLPCETTGVVLGNTLTGEFSRANTLRLRWPYVRRVVESKLIERGWTTNERAQFLESLQSQFKAPFPPVGEESLAGGLSNTIAGRICNHFDLKGGGYTVDGACASSLLAVATSCSALAAGDLDVALAGGVDLSLDPFELVGFAKISALAPEKMRVYDARSAGFWPGEGCGFVVLMREEDAAAQGRRIYAIIRGWGISSDGNGGITRPEVEGQLLAISRAYRRAKFGINSVTYFEGHGTGTSVGDATELKALSQARKEAAPDSPPAVIGSIKANIGHTKAAAGVAGLIKATMALHTQILPPTTGCEQPHPELVGDTPALRALDRGETWPADRPLRAGVSSMGFGGINTHLALEGVAIERRKTVALRESAILSSVQDTELFLIEASDIDGLLKQVEHLSSFAARISRAELADLAVRLQKELDRKGAVSSKARVAIVASNPSELASRLDTLRDWLVGGVTKRLDARTGIFLGQGVASPRIGFLFPGQGSPAHVSGGAMSRRFDFVRELYGHANLPASGDTIATEVAQPAIVTASMAGLRALDRIGIKGSVGVGHSLGELTALHWGGVFDESALLRIAAARGETMARLGSPTGAMASIKASKEQVEALLERKPIVIAGLNSPSQTVISGQTSAVTAFVTQARARNLGAVRLPVSHAFHSPLVAEVAPRLAEYLSSEKFHPLKRRVVSTVTGARIGPDEDLRNLLCRQVTSPVLFIDAVRTAARGLDLMIEVGPGQVLSGLTSEFSDVPVVSVDAGGPSLKGLLEAVGAAFALGAEIDCEALFGGRFTRPFNLDWRPRFFANPCELAPLPGDEARDAATEIRQDEDEQEQDDGEHMLVLSPGSEGQSPLELVRDLVAERAELPSSAVKDDNRLLGDLHLNSITVSQLVAEAAKRLGLPPLVALTDYSNVTVAEVAQALEDLARTGGQVSQATQHPAGIDSWIRAFTVALVERPLPRRQSQDRHGEWQFFAPPDYPLADALRAEFSGWGAGGVVVCLPPAPSERQVGLMLEGARQAFEDKAAQFVLVQHGGGAASFAKTLHLEAAEIITCVIDVPVDHPKAVEWVVEEAKAASGYCEAHYDSSGRRHEPVLRLLANPEKMKEEALTSRDVLLITGGGKGIGAECGITLARQTGARLVLMGRSDPAIDAELAENLERMTDHGIRFRYIAADVADKEAVRRAVSEAQQEFGHITAILHSAGANVPQLLTSLDEASFLGTLAPKVQGVRNLLDAIDPERLRLLVTFGSIIARTGMRGEADYAVANEWMTRLTEEWQAKHPLCRCLAIEWSVWSGVGMGERLGRVESLIQQGITPIPPDEGVAALIRLLEGRLPSASVVVTGRFGQAPTLKMDQPELPLLRFIDQPRVYYPGVELIVDATISTDTDPYLNDHLLQGEQIFPGVLGLEAMAQVATTLGETDEPPVFEEVSFNRPIVVPEASALTIRVAALVREPGSIEVAIRSEETAFQVDHFRALCRIERKSERDAKTTEVVAEIGRETSSVAIAPERDLYGGILFHTGRFQRLSGYRNLTAKQCLAEIAPDGATQWFGSYMPASLVLSDPGARDAAIHAIQACIPHARLLPVGIDRLVFNSTRSSGPCLVRAFERVREGDLFIYDLEMTDLNGHVLERCTGLRLRVVESLAAAISWPPALLGPYIERRIEEMIPGVGVAVVVEENVDADRRRQSDRAIRRALKASVPVRRRPDGKPEVAAREVEVASAHTSNVTMAVVGSHPVSCDIEQVLARPDSVWRNLLGQEHFALAGIIAREAGEDDAAAATRVWGATECLKKAGAMVTAPLMFGNSTADGWVILKSGLMTVATFIAQVRETDERLALAVLVGANYAYA